MPDPSPTVALELYRGPDVRSREREKALARARERCTVGRTVDRTCGTCAAVMSRLTFRKRARDLVMVMMLGDSMALAGVTFAPIARDS